YMEGRMEMLPDQVSMIRDIAKKIKKFTPDSKILVVSNPVDILTYIFQKETEMSRQCVMGVASSLDSSRFRYLVSKELKVKSSQIKNALVLGEHGDSMVPIFSVTKCNNKPVLELLSDSQVDKITKDLRDYWKVLRKFKGPSIFGIAKNTVDVIRAIIKNEELSIPASVMLDGEYGFSDVCLGVPVQIGKEGMIKIQEISLNKYEKDSLIKSAEAIRDYLLTETCRIS
ncbi:MAG: lactate dehydrogenase, partial [Candidatus Heimdallarchaeota archaeon]|nr:lactate dehydrogenase [Candidatus Heimdallarchaeota archaeon]